MSEKIEIEKLKENLKLKEKVFDLIRKNNGKSKEEAKKILEQHKEILSYFIKFKHPPDKEGHQDGKIILLHIGGWIISPNPYYYDEILEDLANIRKEIIQREYLLQQKEFLKAQKEFLDIQKEDIGENKKDRKRLNNFTFILALGVIVAAIFYFMQTFIQFKLSPTIDIMIISGICTLLFLLIIFFIFDSFKMKKELGSFWNNQWMAIIIIAIFIILIIFFGFILPDGPTKMSQTQETILLNQTNYELQETNNLLNISINEQNKISKKLDLIILTQNASNSKT